MSWYWHGAYVIGVSQADLANKIKHLVDTFTDHKMQFNPDYINSRGYAFGGVAFACVSPQLKNWTAFWGGGNKFASELFMANKLSGLIIDGWDEFPFEYTLQKENVWEIQFWENGQLSDWFVSDPEYYFDDWGKSLESFLLPFIQAKTGEKIDKKRKAILEYVKNTPEIFREGIALKLTKYAFPKIGTESLEHFLSLSTLPAIKRLKGILNIPFMGCDYHVSDIAIYLDLEKGIFPVISDLNYLDPFVENRSHRPREWKNQVSQFLPLLFKFADGEDYDSVVLCDYPNLFYWL